MLHGSSGTDPKDLRRVCTMGINKLNVATDLFWAICEAYRDYDYQPQTSYQVWHVGHAAQKAKLSELFDLYGCNGKAWTRTPEGVTAYDYENNDLMPK